jgi:hypothetical protein
MLLKRFEPKNHLLTTVLNEDKLFHVDRTEPKNLSKSALTRVMVSFSSVYKKTKIKSHD